MILIRCGRLHPAVRLCLCLCGVCLWSAAFLALFLMFLPPLCFGSPRPTKHDHSDCSQAGRHCFSPSTAISAVCQSRLRFCWSAPRIGIPKGFVDQSVGVQAGVVLGVWSCPLHAGAQTEAPCCCAVRREQLQILWNVLSRRCLLRLGCSSLVLVIVA